MSKLGLTTTDEGAPLSPAAEERVGLVLAAATEEPGRVGEVLLLMPGSPERLLGRGGALPGDRAPRVQWLRQRPGNEDVRPPLRGRYTSRQALLLRPEVAGVDVERMGRSTIRVNGSVTERALARPGDTVQVGSHLLLTCVARPAQLSPSAGVGDSAPSFGEPDEFGYLGESVAAWRLRSQLRTLAATPGHVLLIGDGGTGKELAARTLHAQGTRSAQQLITRSAATLSAQSVDSELFGNVADYPVPGTSARPGLVGEADGGTLYLDDLGALSRELHRVLLRVLDEDGDYQPAGASTSRSANLRVIASVESAASLAPQLLARFPLQLRVPGLKTRVCDIPLLARYLVLRAARRQPSIGEQFVVGWDGQNGEPRLSVPLVERLLRHDFQQHVRELESLLMLSTTTSDGDTLKLTPELEERLGDPKKNNEDIGPDDIRAALERRGGSREQAAQDLGLKNRYALFRLMKKLDVQV